LFLATTALEEFWNKDEKILFLGEWCKLYDRKEELEKLDYETLDFEWNDLEKQKKAIIYCNDIYENILDELVVILNKYHNINEDKRYWRILLSSWLLPFIQIIYDKYTHIQNALNIDDGLHTYTLNESNYYIPFNFTNFSQLISNKEEYHLQLYSQIFKILNDNYQDIDNGKVDKRKNKYILKTSFKEKIMRVGTKILNQIFQNKNILIVQPYFKSNSILSICKLFIKSKFLFIFDNLQYIINVDNQDNINLRKKIFKNDEVGFKNLVYKLFIYNFPKIYIENYKDFNISVNKLNLNIPKVVFSSGAIHGNDIFKFFVAQHKIRLLYKQHGGGYGLELLLTSEKIERDISDYYYTQGWNDGSKTVAISNKSFKLKKNNSLNINFIMTEMPRYIYRFNFAEDSSKMLNYIENSKQFLSTFKNIDNLTIRMYMQDYQWNIKDRLLEINKNLIFDNQTNYYKQITNAKLNIFDHMHTGYLETLSMNIPTVIIIPKNIYYFRNSVKPYIQKLKDAKILFEDPIEASEFVDKVYDDIDKWWQSDKVQKNRKEFCYNYSRVSENWVDEWIDEFSKVLNNART